MSPAPRHRPRKARRASPRQGPARPSRANRSAASRRPAAGAGTGARTCSRPAPGGRSRTLRASAPHRSARPRWTPGTRKAGRSGQGLRPGADRCGCAGGSATTPAPRSVPPSPARYPAPVAGRDRRSPPAPGSPASRRLSRTDRPGNRAPSPAGNREIHPACQPLFRRLHARQAWLDGKRTRKHNGYANYAKA
ncbi:Uncharacterised protein [Acinetobacter baumannii]|nr:Uncharacterised protein [Acinetobacter baumannii]